MKLLQLVTFEQAKKLKQLGFDWKCRTCFPSGEDVEIIETGCSDYNRTNESLSAPIVALALKWLRDERKVYVDIFLDNTGTSGDKFFIRFCGIERPEVFRSYETYEQAELAGLDYALDYLLKNKIDPKYPEVKQTDNGDGSITLSPADPEWGKVQIVPFADKNIKPLIGKCEQCGAEQFLSYVTCNYNGICKGRVLPIKADTDGQN